MFLSTTSYSGRSESSGAEGSSLLAERLNGPGQTDGEVTEHPCIKQSALPARCVES